jgi:hypothetical protein
MSDAQQARLDREMLRSMSASLSSGLAFSFHPKDMANLLFRMSEMVDPKPKLATRPTPTLAEALAVPEVAAMWRALLTWDAAHRTGKNEPLHVAFELGQSALDQIKEVNNA